MKILIDQNISFRLAQRILHVFSEVEHVKTLGLTDANDYHIFMLALSHFWPKGFFTLLL